MLLLQDSQDNSHQLDINEVGQHGLVAFLNMKQKLDDKEDCSSQSESVFADKSISSSSTPDESEIDDSNQECKVHHFANTSIQSSIQELSGNKSLEKQEFYEEERPKSTFFGGMLHYLSNVNRKKTNRVGVMKEHDEEEKQPDETHSARKEYELTDINSNRDCESSNFSFSELDQQVVNQDFG